jgi:uncharacterized protein (TIGR02996 family)
MIVCLATPATRFGTMTDRAAFIAAIVRRPDDDLPRLVYADYLDERGDGPRAEFIRLQCAAARGDTALPSRVAELEDEHREEWLAALGPGVYHAEFRRGFPEHLVMVAGEFVRDGNAIHAATPLRGLTLVHAGRVLARLLAEPHLAGLTALHFTGGMLGDAGIERLAECPHLAGVRTLRLGQNEVGDTGAAALANSPFLAQLRLLVLNQNAIGDSGAWELARSPYLGRLAALDLSENEISPLSLAMLQNSPWLENLADLHADGQRSTNRWSLPALLAGKADV